MSLRNNANLLSLQNNLDLHMCPCKENNFINKNRKIKNNSKIYFLLSGPTFANNKPHIGTIYNIILKDSISKLHLIKGINLCVFHGFDMHGVPIERKLLETYKPLDSKDFAQKCSELSHYYKNEMISYFKDIKSLSIHENFYDTTNPNILKKQLNLIYKMYENQYVIESNMHVNFCTECLTFLSISEIEKSLVKTHSLFFEVKTTCDKWLIIWTTTPYSIVFNQAIIYGNLEYVEFKYNNKIYITSHTFFKENNFNVDFRFINLEKIKYFHPINQNILPVLYDSSVGEKGTGLLHASANMSIIDYNILLKNKIKEYKNIFKYGKFFVKDNWLNINETINFALENIIIFKHEFIKKEKNICWRCKTSTIEILSKQWFIDLNKIKNDVLKNIKQMNLLPEKLTLFNSVKKREQWCVSRQRYWGVFLPAFQCLSCDKRYFIPKSYFENYIENINTELDWLNYNKNINCVFCNSSKTQKLTEIMDVWIDSGIIPNIIENIGFLIEGIDQNRGWFQSSVILNNIIRKIEGEKFFDYKIKNIIYHKFVKDSFGEKISKSKNNSIDIKELLDTIPVDILRLSFLSQEINSDIIFSQELISQTKEQYIAIRILLVFLSKHCEKGEINNYFHKQIIIYINNQLKIILDKTTNKKSKIFCDLNYLFRKILSLIQIINIYFIESLKNEIFKENNLSAKAVLYEIMRLLTVYLYPFIPVTSADICEQMKFNTDLNEIDRELNIEYIEWFINLKNNIKIKNDNIIILAPKNLQRTIKETSNNIENLFFKYKKNILIEYE